MRPKLTKRHKRYTQDNLVVAHYHHELQVKALQDNTQQNVGGGSPDGFDIFGWVYDQAEAAYNYADDQIEEAAEFVDETVDTLENLLTTPEGFRYIVRRLTD